MNSSADNPKIFEHCLKAYIRYNIIYLRTCIAYEKKFYRDDMRNEVKNTARLHSIRRYATKAQIQSVPHNLYVPAL